MPALRGASLVSDASSFNERAPQDRNAPPRGVAAVSDRGRRSEIDATIYVGLHSRKIV